MRKNIVQKITVLLLLVLASVTASRGQSTKIDATRLLKPSGTNSRLLVTNSGGATAWTDAENILSGATGISITGNTIGLTLGGSAGNIQFNNTTALGGSANLNWDNSNVELQIGQPLSGTGRIIIKGSNTNNTTYSFQGFDSGDTERSRITNGGYFQGTGASRIGFDYGTAFTLDARLHQPTSVTSAVTSGSSALVSFAGGFTPPGGNAVVNLVEVVGTIDQSAGATGKTRMMYLAANAVSTANMFGLETVGGYNLIGNGTVPEVMPRLGVVGLGTTGSTNALGVYNSSGTPLFFVGDDAQVAIGGATSSYTLDITGNDAIRIPRGTTAQRPTTNSGIFRFNTTDTRFEGYDGTSWIQFGALVSHPASSESIQNTNFTAVKFRINLVDCSSGAITVTPPSSPVIGERFAISDAKANAATNNITVGFSAASQKLYGVTQNYVLNVNGGYVEFIYVGATTGWIATK